MDLDFSPEDLAFREEARAFLAENYPKALREKQGGEAALTREDYFSWHRILAKKGWAVPSWPAEWGGTGWTPTQKYIWSEEQAKADTIGIIPFGVAMLGPVIYTFGTEEQKERFLPGIRDGLVWWCQGYSEPGAGSDLARLQTRAERIKGDDGKEYYLVNGQKTWTTLAQFADWGFFLVRTDPNAKPQAGISFLLIDMKSPGITVRPIITLDGCHEVNDVFLDNVKVPVENRIFHENQGWTCAKALLQHERSGIAGVARSKR
ncbi:MAG: acyl-CoA dehydrogenase family protein, partial [Caulobacteraceae bacterium]